MRRLFPFFIIIFLILGCRSSDDENIIFIEPVGTAEYFIKNSSSQALDIVFIKSEQLGMGIDSSKTVMSGTSLKVFTDGIIGKNPLPTDSFHQIDFFVSPKESNSPKFTISPITNEDWNLIEREIRETGYHLTRFELTITDDNLE